MPDMYFNLVVHSNDPDNSLVDRLTVQSFTQITEARRALRLATQHRLCQMAELADNSGLVIEQAAGPERACLMVGR